MKLIIRLFLVSLLCMVSAGPGLWAVANSKDNSGSSSSDSQKNFNPYTNKTGLFTNSALVETKYECHSVLDNFKDDPEMQKMLGLSPQPQSQNPNQQNQGVPGSAN